MAKKSVRWNGVSLSNNQLRWWAGNRVFQRGAQYASQGRVQRLNLRKGGGHLSGARLSPEDVKVLFS